MISLDDVNDMVSLHEHDVPTLMGVTGVIPAAHLALLTDSPYLRRPLIDLLSGLRPPMQGRIRRQGSVSWPIGRASFLQRHLTGLDVVKYLARIYDLDIEATLVFLGEIMTEPWQVERQIANWSAFSKLEFGNSLALLPRFDIYFVEGVLSFSKDRFGRIWEPLFRKRIHGKTMIMSSYSLPLVRQYCTSALILVKGKLSVDDELERAIARVPIGKIPVYDTEAAEDDLDEDEDQL